MAAQYPEELTCDMAEAYHVLDWRALGLPLAATLAADVQAAAPAEEKPEGQHRYVCKVCGYVYEGDSLPEDYKCPLCGAGAEYFKQES